MCLQDFIQSGINPERVAATLTVDDWKEVLCHARELFKIAIKIRGTSISDWRDLYGCKGQNQYE